MRYLVVGAIRRRRHRCRYVRAQERAAKAGPAPRVVRAEAVTLLVKRHLDFAGGA